MQNTFDQNHILFALLIACLVHAHCHNTHGPFNFKLFQFESKTRVRFIKLGMVPATKAWIQFHVKQTDILTTLFMFHIY